MVEPALGRLFPGDGGSVALAAVALAFPAGFLPGAQERLGWRCAAGVKAGLAAVHLGFTQVGHCFAVIGGDIPRFGRDVPSVGGGVPIVQSCPRTFLVKWQR